MLSFEKSKKEMPCDVYTLKVPNFFTLPEYDSSFRINSPSFEFVNATWCFQFSNEDCEKDGRRKFAVFMKAVNSEIPSQLIFYKITLLDASYTKYDDESDRCSFENETCHLCTFDNQSLPYDRRDTLILVIHLICRKSLLLQKSKASGTQDLHDKMEEEGKHCKISLKRSKKSISCDMYTLNISILCALKNHPSLDAKITSSSFEFADETWCFHFQSPKPQEYFDFCLLRLSSEENNAKKNLKVGKQIFFFVTAPTDFQEYNDSEFQKESLLTDSERFELCWMTTRYLVPSDTLSVLLYPAKLLDMDIELLRTEGEGVDLLTKDLKELFMNGKNYDLTLRVAEKDFPVHKAILMARSPVFEAMLSHDMIEENSGVIDVPDCDPRVMEQFLFYVYSGKVEILNQDNALGLYNAAAKFNMMLLKNYCSEIIKKSLSPSIISDVIQLSSKHNDTDLLECATEYFLNHTSEIVPTQEWLSFMKLNLVAANELLIKAFKKRD